MWVLGLENINGIDWNCQFYQKYQLLEHLVEDVTNRFVEIIFNELLGIILW